MSDEIIMNGDDQNVFDAMLDDAEAPKSDAEWLRLTKSMFKASSDYYEQSLQNDWEISARHWNSEHAGGSKFKSDAYKFRSKLFRPLTRTTERNSSAAAAAALFSNMDVLDVSPSNPLLDGGTQAAAITKSLLQHRLKKDVKWYLTTMGAWQDAFNYGVCISYINWDYLEREVDDDEALEGEILSLDDVELNDDSVIEMVDPMTEGVEYVENFGSMRGVLAQNLQGIAQRPKKTEVVKDNLVIDLIPPENFRASPACDWRDVVGTSPYVIRMVPIYVVDIEERMESGEWFQLPRTQILSLGKKNMEYDAVRKAREGDDRSDSRDETTMTGGMEFESVYVHENFVRIDGEEWVYWTLGTDALLTEPKPISEVYWHGKRPIVFGFSVIEAHKYSPNGQSKLIRPLQENINDLSNQRIDNIKLAMNKRYVVRRGAHVDLAALARNAPGGSVTADNPREDVQVVSTPDVTASSYEEVNRLTVEANEIAGSFSGSSVQSNRQLNETVGGMQLLSEGANQLQEFDIRTFVETWVRPTLDTALLTLQAYEDDETIIAIAGQKGLEKWPELDIDSIFPNRNDIWNMPMTLEVNVGLGATTPFQRIQNLNTAMGMAQPFLDPARIDRDEIVSEIFAAAGFQDGSRFYMSEQEAQERMQGKPPELPPEVQIEQMKLAHEKEMKQAEIAAEMQKAQMEMQLKREIEMLKIAASGDKTMKQLQADREALLINDKTKRDSVAIQEGTKQNEMQLRRDTGAGI